jgi:type IV pilus assembly protein PilB
MGDVMSTPAILARGDKLTARVRRDCLPKDKNRPRIGDLLAQSGLTSRLQVENAARIAQDHGLPLGEVLVNSGAVDERDVYRMLAQQHRLPFAEFTELIELADREVAHEVSKRYQELHHLVVLAKQDDAVVVACTEPCVDCAEVAAAVGVHHVDLRLMTPTDYRRLVLALALEPAPVAIASTSDAAAIDLLREDAVSTGSLALLDSLLLEAIAERASDIHLELYRSEIRLRLRVDGDLRDLTRLDLTPMQHVALVNVIKIRAKLDIAERRVPQGGRFSTRSGERVFDVRVQTQPTLHGEHVILRLLPQDTRIISITELGFQAHVAQAYRRLLESPQGLVLVVGPTGSGKSTTLYAGLKLLAADMTRKAITIEDPIEYALDHVQQSQVRPELGWGFAQAMRAFVREDPDVILIGEIRDGETALEAVRASQTGHLVLSTLHCNDSVDAVQRLLDLGLHQNSITSELIAVFAQRLAKRICEACKVPDTAPNPALLAELFGTGGPPAGFRAWRGKGCARCSWRGTFGRIAVVEHLTVGTALRRAIVRRPPVDELRSVALDAGLVPLRDEALAAVAAGSIALDELRLLLSPERLVPQRRSRSDLSENVGVNGQPRSAA